MKYPLYKGLQHPLVFKMFKGKYIYWALGSIIAGIVTGGIISATVSSVVGIMCMALISAPLLLFVITKQKKGLHTKNKYTGALIHSPKFFPVKHEKKV
jgi:mannitol-specific phosphotransferase system IIBC component